MADEVSPVACEKAETTLGLHKFAEQLIDQTVHFQVLKMTDSLFLWIGSSAEMGSLAVAMRTKYVSRTSGLSSHNGWVPLNISYFLDILEDSYPTWYNYNGSMPGLH